MKSFAIFAAVPLLAGWLCAQTADPQSPPQPQSDRQSATQTQSDSQSATQTQPDGQTTQSETTSTTTSTSAGNTYNGILVDEGCVTKNTETKETAEHADNSTTTTTTKTSTTTCPVTSSTTSFALQTADGKYIHFDGTSNAKIVEMVKSNDLWKKSMNTRQPISVRVVATPSGDVYVVESMK
jgi:hypothetical protein